MKASRFELLKAGLAGFFALTSIILVPSAMAQSAKTPTVSQAVEVKSATAGIITTCIKVEFQMDPHIAQGVYMGEIWVSPPKFVSVQDGKNPLAIEARAMGLDAQGKQVEISPDWKAGDPSVIRVSPTRGAKVKITVIKEGQSELVLTCGGISRKLTVKVVDAHGALRAEISQ